MGMVVQYEEVMAVLSTNWPYTDTVLQKIDFILHLKVLLLPQVHFCSSWMKLSINTYVHIYLNVFYQP